MGASFGDQVAERAQGGVEALPADRGVRPRALDACDQEACLTQYGEVVRRARPAGLAAGSELAHTALPAERLLDEGRVVVAFKTHCLTGCSQCATPCEAEAISFPTVEGIKRARHGS